MSAMIDAARCVCYGKMLLRLWREVRYNHMMRQRCYARTAQRERYAYYTHAQSLDAHMPPPGAAVLLRHAA